MPLSPPGSIAAELELINRRLSAIENELTRYKGFLSGMAFLLSGIVVLFEIFKDWIARHFSS